MKSEYFLEVCCLLKRAMTQKKGPFKKSQKAFSNTYSKGMHFLVFSQVKCLAWQVSFGQSGGSSLPSRQSGEKSQCFDIGMQFWPSAHLNQSGSWSSHCSICCWPSLFEAFEAKNKVDKIRITNQQRISWFSHIFGRILSKFFRQITFLLPGMRSLILDTCFQTGKMIRRHCHHLKLRRRRQQLR